MFTRSANRIEVEVEVNLKETKILAGAGTGSFLDARGALLIFEAGALWRVESKDMSKKKIAGGGTRWISTVGEKIPLDEIRFPTTRNDWSGCETEEGVFWCATIRSFNSLLQVDTHKGEVTVLFLNAGNGCAGGGGYFGEEATTAPKATVYQPRGPLVSTIGPNGRQVYFRDYNNQRVAELRSKMISVPWGGAPNGYLSDPSLLRPSKKMSFGQASPGTSPTSIGSRLAWVSVQDNYHTRLVDLNTGQNVLLFQSRMRPLLTISSSLTLAVQQEGNGMVWIVGVDWSLPSDLASSTTIVQSSESQYLIPNERITRLAQLSNVFNAWNCNFWFDSSSNRLYCDLSTNGITTFSNLFKIRSKIVNDNNRLIYPSFMQADLSKLLTKGCTLPSDLKLTHSASNTSWNVHYDILGLHESLKKKQDIVRLAKIIRESKLPASSISAFFNFLYFAPPTELTNATESFMPVCHCIQLCNQIGLGTDATSCLLWLLEEKIMPKMSNEALLQKIFRLWLVQPDSSPESIATYEKTSPLMNLLASRCRKYISEAEIQEATNHLQKITAPMARVVELCYFLYSTSLSALVQPELSPLPPSIPMQPLEWDEKLEVASLTPPKDKHAYVFKIEGLKTGGIICNSLLLYTQWKWFERLCKAQNSEEVRTRHVTLSKYFTPSALHAILASCYRTFSPARSLSTVDMAVVCLFSGELQLSETTCFAELIEICHETLHSTVNDANCLEKLQEFWTAGFDLQQPLFVDTLKTVFKNRNSITLGGLSKLPLRLRVLVGASLDHTKARTPDDFVAIATALEQSLDTVGTTP